MAFTHCILCTRYTREQNTTCKGHLSFQKATISLENDDHNFFSILSLLLLLMQDKYISETPIVRNATTFDVGICFPKPKTVFLTQRSCSILVPSIVVYYKKSQGLAFSLYKAKTPCFIHSFFFLFYGGQTAAIRAQPALHICI